MNEADFNADADVADRRQEVEDGPEQKEDGEGCRANARRTGGEGDRPGELRASDSQRLDIPAEYHDAEPLEKSEILMGLSRWRGALPPPDEFAKFSPSVQKEIVRWSGQQFDDNHALVEHAMKMEEEQSKRLDRYVELDEKQVPFAQRSSFVLNALLIVLTAILAFNDKDLAAGMSLGSLVLINAASMYVQVRGLGDSKHSDDEDSED